MGNCVKKKPSVHYKTQASEKARPPKEAKDRVKSRNHTTTIGNKGSRNFPLLLQLSQAFVVFLFDLYFSLMVSSIDDLPSGERKLYYF